MPARPEWAVGRALRVRGKAVEVPGTDRQRGRAPRVRGEAALYDEQDDGQRKSPACTVESPKITLSDWAHEEEPRVCGEEDIPSGILEHIFGGAPRVWGKGEILAPDIAAREEPRVCGGGV